MLQYLPTILICIALAALFGLLLWSLIRDKKKGKSSCGGCCSSCAMGCHCHSAPQKPADGSKPHVTPEGGKGAAK